MTAAIFHYQLWINAERTLFLKDLAIAGGLFVMAAGAAARARTKGVVDYVREETPNLQAAAKEFNEHGFGGTDTNRIARRAGFAPQTFYRWFQDKEEIFIKTYEHWQREEFGAIGTLFAENASDLRVARAVVAHHEAYLVFRRSLRQLSVENESSVRPALGVV